MMEWNNVEAVELLDLKQADENPSGVFEQISPE